VDNRRCWVCATHEKADILLVSLSLLHPEPGKHFKLDNFRERSLAVRYKVGDIREWMESLENTGKAKKTKSLRF